MQILELNENGEYIPVEVVSARDIRTGGIFQLKQVSIPHVPAGLEITLL